MAKSISIVIPVYNEQDHLKDCLDSIASQTQKPNEVIVIDNNSTDATVDIANSYPFVKVLHEPKQGVVYARNRGYNAATSELICRIDGDSILPTTWIQQVQRFYIQPEHQNQALTGGGYFYNIRAPRLNGWFQNQLAYRMNRFIVGHYILWGSNMALPYALWREVEPNICMRTDIHEDLDLAIHLHRLGYPIAFRSHLRVGVYLKRLYENRNQQKEHTSKWPRTLRTHSFHNWWLGSIGNVFLLYILQPIAFILEGISRLFHRQLQKR